MPDNFGSSPLHLACISGNLMAVKLLCAKSSVELEPRDRNRKTPLDLAAKHGHEDIIKFLESEKRRRNTFLPVFLDIWYVFTQKTLHSSLFSKESLLKTFKFEFKILNI